jgi:hypothetical protein
MQVAAWGWKDHVGVLMRRKHEIGEEAEWELLTFLTTLVDDSIGSVVRCKLLLLRGTVANERGIKPNI